jgi:DNA-binding NtrC family response regulator
MVVANSTSLEEAARILEIDKSTLYRKRKQMEARVEVFAAQSSNRELREMAVATGS